MAKERAEFDIVFSTGSAQQDIQNIIDRVKIFNELVRTGNGLNAEVEGGYRRVNEELEDYVQLILQASLATEGNAELQHQLAGLLDMTTAGRERAKKGLKSFNADQEQTAKSAELIELASLKEVSGYNLVEAEVRKVTASYKKLTTEGKSTETQSASLIGEIERLIVLWKKEGRDLTVLEKMFNLVTAANERNRKSREKSNKSAVKSPFPKLSKQLEQLTKNYNTATNAAPRFEMGMKKMDKVAEQLTKDTMDLVASLSKEERAFFDASGAGKKYLQTMRTLSASTRRTNVALSQSTGVMGSYTKSTGQVNAAISNASFALQDFLTVMQGGGGFERAVLSTTNNLGMMANMLMGPVSGAIAGVAAAVVSMLIPVFMRWMSTANEASEATKEWADTASDKIDEIREAAKDAIKLRTEVDGMDELSEGVAFAQEQFAKWKDLEAEALVVHEAALKKLDVINKAYMSEGINFYERGLRGKASVSEKVLAEADANTKKAAMARDEAVIALQTKTTEHLESLRNKATDTNEEAAKRELKAEIEALRRNVSIREKFEEDKVEIAKKGGKKVAHALLGWVDPHFDPALATQLHNDRKLITDYENWRLGEIAAAADLLEAQEMEEEAMLEGLRVKAMNDLKEFKTGQVREQSEADALIIDARKKFNKQIDDLIDDSDDRREKELKDLKANLQAQAFALGDAGKEFKRAMAKLQAELDSIAKKKEEKRGPPGKPKPFLDRLQQINADRMAQGLDPIHARSREGRAIRRQAHEDEKRFKREQHQRRRGQRGRAKKADRFFHDPASVGGAREETGRETGAFLKRTDLNRMVDQILADMFTVPGTTGEKMRRGIVKQIDATGTPRARGANAGAAFQGTVDKNQVLQEVVDLLKMAGETQSITNQSMAELIAGIDNMRAQQHSNKRDADNLKKNATTTTRRRSR